MKAKLTMLFFVVVVLVGCAPQGSADCPVKYTVTIEDTQNIASPAIVYYVSRFGVPLKQGALAMYLADTCQLVEVSPSIYQSVTIEETR